MPGSGKYTKYTPLVPANPGSKGSRKSDVLYKTFGTPVEIVNQVKILATANSYTFGAESPSGYVQGDLGYFPAGVNLRFAGAPAIGTTDVPKLGAGGLPASPWTPNITSPGEGNGVDASKQPVLGLANPLNPIELAKNYQVDTQNIAPPQTTSIQIGVSVPLSANPAALSLGAHAGSDPPKFD
jgi:hypothetical protein